MAGPADEGAPASLGNQRAILMRMDLGSPFSAKAGKTRRPGLG